MTAVADVAVDSATTKHNIATVDNSVASCVAPISRIYYFGYGPIVNALVRKRRGIKTLSDEAAMLPEYRLTFTYGGLVNAIRQRGYRVHGVLLAFGSEEDWAQFQEFDAGYNLDQVQVYPMNNPDEPVLAYALVMDREFSDRDKVNGGPEKLPQERYLKLIAAGMRAYQIDDDYIEDHIMSVPYIPKAKPENFKHFPQTRPALRRISLRRYQERLCRNAGSADIYFVVGRKVVRVDSHDPSNPCSVWLKERAHGLPDVTLTLHQTVVDPDLVMVDDAKDITPQHIAWAENHLVEWLEQGGMSATSIFELAHDEQDEQFFPRRPLLYKLFGSCCSCRKLNSVVLEGSTVPVSASQGNQNSSNSHGSTQSTTNSQSNRGGSRRGLLAGSSSRMLQRGIQGNENPSGVLDNGEERLLDSPSGTLNTVTLSMELMRRTRPEDVGDTTDEEEDDDEDSYGD